MDNQVYLKCGDFWKVTFSDDSIDYQYLGEQGMVGENPTMEDWRSAWAVELHRRAFEAIQFHLTPQVEILGVDAYEYIQVNPEESPTPLEEA